MASSLFIRIVTGVFIVGMVSMLSTCIKISLSTSCKDVVFWDKVARHLTVEKALEIHSKALKLKRALAIMIPGILICLTVFCLTNASHKLIWLLIIPVNICLFLSDKIYDIFNECEWAIINGEKG